jgi:hypothetical protein
MDYRTVRDIIHFSVPLSQTQILLAQFGIIGR